MFDRVPLLVAASLAATLFGACGGDTQSAGVSAAVTDGGGYGDAHDDSATDATAQDATPKPSGDGAADALLDGNVVSPADAAIDADGTVADAATELPPGCDCTPATVTWGSDGGLSQYVDSSTLAACRTYTHTRHFGSQSTPDLTCGVDLHPCGSDALGIGDVVLLLADPDVKAALGAAPVLYGRDDRPVDGTVLRIQVGSAVVEVGSDCNGASGCPPIPAGVAALRDLLRNLDAQELGEPQCSQVFEVP